MFDFSEEEIHEFHLQVSKNVKKFRKLKKLSQMDLSLDLGFSNSSFLSQAENPKMTRHHFSLEHLYKISQLLDIDMNKFLKY